MSTPPPSFEELQTRIDSLRQGSDPGRHGAAAALPLPALPRRARALPLRGRALALARY